MKGADGGGQFLALCPWGERPPFAGPPTYMPLFRIPAEPPPVRTLQRIRPAARGDNAFTLEDARTHFDARAACCAAFVAYTYMVCFSHSGDALIILRRCAFYFTLEH